MRLTDSLAGRALILGVDRLDYTKGLPHRLRGFAQLLRRFPEHRKRVRFLQIAPVSRGDVSEYRTLRRELDELVGTIDGEYADFDWTPLRYLTRSVARGTLAGFHRHARVGLVTPLRDGMNLVAKEYVAAQRPEDPGALVLSRFAGAAQELKSAILVNPYDPDEIAEGIASGADDASRGAAGTLAGNERDGLAQHRCRVVEPISCWAGARCITFTRMRAAMRRCRGRSRAMRCARASRGHRAQWFLDYGSRRVTCLPVCGQRDGAPAPPWETSAAWESTGSLFLGARVAGGMGCRHSGYRTS